MTDLEQRPHSRFWCRPGAGAVQWHPQAPLPGVEAGLPVGHRAQPKDSSAALQGSLSCRTLPVSLTFTFASSGETAELQSLQITQSFSSTTLRHEQHHGQPGMVPGERCRSGPFLSSAGPWGTCMAQLPQRGARARSSSCSSYFYNKILQ